MKKFWYVYDSILKIIVMTTTGSFVVLILNMVFFRYVLGNSITWGEEICRMLFFATIMFGSPVCVTEKRHIVLDMFPSALPRAGKRWLFLGIYIAMFLCGIFLIFFGYRFAMMNTRQVTAALMLPLWKFYLIIPVSAVFFSINVVRVAILDWTVTYAPVNGETKKEMA